MKPPSSKISCLALLACALPCLVVAASSPSAHGERGYFGFRLESKGDQALVSDVAPDGPGGRAGLRAGDAVIAFNGVPFNFTSDYALMRELAWVRPGVPVDLILLRGQKKLAVTIVPARFRAEDLAALDDWLRRAELTEQGRRKSCALEAFKALAAPPGLEVSFRKEADGKGYTMSTAKHDLPPDLDLSESFLEQLLGAVKPGDSVLLRYQWSRGALRSEVVKVPEYVKLDEISRQALDKVKAAGGRVRTPG